MANLESHQSWGQESLELALAYAFHELNLFRVDVTTAEYQIHLRELLVKTGFQSEVRQRAAAYRSGKTWDRLRCGLLREEYEKTGVTDNPRKTKDPTITGLRKKPAMTPEFLTGGPITDVFRGKLVHLCTLEPERDAECMARWTRDSEYDRLLNGEPAYMWKPKHVEEWLENQVTNGLFFMIRTLSDDRSVGYLDHSR